MSGKVENSSDKLFLNPSHSGPKFWNSRSVNFRLCYSPFSFSFFLFTFYPSRPDPEFSFFLLLLHNPSVCYFLGSPRLIFNFYFFRVNNFFCTGFLLQLLAFERFRLRNFSFIKMFSRTFRFNRSKISGFNWYRIILIIRRFGL